MNPNTAYHPYKKIVLISIAFVGGIILLSLLIMLLQRLFYRNPFGEEIRIDNFSSYFSDTPTEQQEMIFHGLYNAVARSRQPQPFWICCPRHLSRRRVRNLP